MMFNGKQPTKSFVEDLKKELHTQAPPAWHLREVSAEEADVSKARLVQEFPDPEGLLETAYEDFGRFMEVGGMSEADRADCYIVRTAFRQTDCFEAYEIMVEEACCTVFAKDTEGIRRGLIWLEDEMSRREGPYLPLGTMKRKPYVKNRISRNFFSPTSHDAEEEELATDVDYYPESYLNRLAHDGINGLWIFVHFRTLLPSEVIPEYGRNYSKYIEKLRNTVAKCKRYGIKIYVLGVEPASTHLNPVLYEHPEVLGSSFWGGGGRALCISTEKGRAYIEECGRTLFTLVPDLAGMINISVGEAVAGCGSVGTPDEITCPHCKAAGLTKAKALAEYEKALLKGMRQAKPDAELISWTYSHRSWNMDMVEEYLACRSEDIVLMENFEDAGEALQLGKPHLAMDYYLSYTGPGKVFQTAAKWAAKRKTPLYAKLQVGNSHEVASVPYVPVPGKLYDKFRYMYEHGIEGAVYCWYFGNYPSMMNKAASELAFSDFTESKEAFLEKLASVYWGKEKEKVAAAWRKFEEGYSLFPVNVAFTWFGPMTDGIVWPLHLEPVDLPVSSNWMLDDEVGTDRVGEFLAQGHNLEDAIVLCETMYRCMAEGVQLLEQAKHCDREERTEQLSVARALALLFESGTDIMRFYRLRNQLAYAAADLQQDILSKMQKLADREKVLTGQMLTLCNADSRLGYHSEADGYKFFPEKLAWRLQKLEELDWEFEAVRGRLAAGQPALPYYYGSSERSKSYQCDRTGWEPFEEGTARIRISDIGDAYRIEIEGTEKHMVEIKAEFTLFQPYVPVYISPNGEVRFLEPTYYFMHDSMVEAELQKWHVTRDGNRLELTLYKKDFDLTEDRPFRLSVRAGKHNWKSAEKTYGRLIWGGICPESMVFIV